MHGGDHALSISASSSVLNEVFFNAFRFFCSWFTELAPTITDVTLSSLSNHANAISAKLCPRSLAISDKRFSYFNNSSVNAARRKKCPSAIREPSSTFPDRYLSDKSPWAKGEKATNPAPASFALVRSPSCSTSRFNRLYRSWYNRHGTSRSRK